MSHGRLTLGEYISRGFPRDLQDHTPDRGIQSDVKVTDVERSLEAVLDLVQQGGNLSFDSVTTEEEIEFVPPEITDQPLLPADDAQPPRGLHQDLIRERHPIGGVELFEVIDIDREQGRAWGLWIDPVDGFLDALHKERS